MSLNLEHVYNNALCSLRLLIKKLDLNVAVGPFNYNDWMCLTCGHSELNWDHFITCYSSKDNAIDFCVKFKDDTKNVILGASISVCDLEEKSFNIYCIERFSRNSDDCILKGRMVFLVLSLAFLISLSMKMERIRLIDVDNKAYSLIDYYKTFGFDSDPENQQNMIVDLSVLESNLK